MSRDDENDTNGDQDGALESSSSSDHDSDSKQQRAPGPPHENFMKHIHRLFTEALKRDSSSEPQSKSEQLDDLQYKIIADDAAMIGLPVDTSTDDFVVHSASIVFTDEEDDEDDEDDSDLPEGDYSDEDDGFDDDDSDEDDDDEDDEDDEDSFPPPSAPGRVVLPILPLRNAVLFPYVIMPLAIGRERSLEAVRAVSKFDGVVATVTQRSSEVDDPASGDLYTFGSAAKIVKSVIISENQYSVIVQGERRLKLEKLIRTEPYLIGEFTPLEEDDTRDIQIDALIRNVKVIASQLVSHISEMPREVGEMIEHVESPSKLCNFIAAHIPFSIEERQQLLAEMDLKSRLETILSLLSRHMEVVKVSDQIQRKVKQEIDRNQKEYFLRQQAKAIKEQLGEFDGDSGDLDELEARIQEKDLPEEIEKVIKKQFARLQQMQPASSDYGVTRTYVETLLDIPWKEESKDSLDIKRAQELLDQDHHGLDKVKERLIEFLAVRKLRKDMKGPILCLVGPPGVGKTSLGKSVAAALNRKFVRISLGGVRDEAEIRGHRRTYVGALPGRVVQALRKAGVRNPVIMLDEIDKVGRDFRGDPQAALLEVLDPEQNNSFSDHYVEQPVDLSSVLFIANANQMDTISAPLRDRMEVIDIPGYTANDKFEIVKRFMLPRQIENHGIDESHIDFSDEAVSYIIERYTREAGVRNLERRIADVCRKVAVMVVKEELDGPYQVTAETLPDLLGPERYDYEMAERVNDPGIATGLAWTPSGGDILYIEAVRSQGKGELRLTGQLGDVMKESAMAALSYLKMNAANFGLEPNFLRETDIHIHFPAGAVPKDGPSAGIAIFTTVLSLFTGIQVRHDVAMTGEITLRGNVLAVGGIKEKTLAAHRAGITRVLLPERNRKDLVDIAPEVKAELEIMFVSHVSEVPALALTESPKSFAAASSDKGASGEEE